MTVEIVLDKTNSLLGVVVLSHPEGWKLKTSDRMRVFSIPAFAVLPAQAGVQKEGLGSLETWNYFSSPIIHLICCCHVFSQRAGV
jgi:hypothetical protein